LLSQAVLATKRKLVEALLAAGASASARNKAGATALHLAVTHNVPRERNRLAETVLSVRMLPSLKCGEMHPLAVSIIMFLLRSRQRRVMQPVIKCTVHVSFSWEQLVVI